MKLLNRSAITLLAKEPFARWIASLPEGDELNQPTSLEELRREGNIYLMTEAEHESDFAKVLVDEWDNLWRNELAAWDEFGDYWPSQRSLAVFKEWFEISHQVMAFDLSSEPLLVAKLD